MDYYYAQPVQPAATDPTTSIALLLLLGMLFFFALIFAVTVYVVHSFFLGRIFHKAGLPQWTGWIPVYREWRFLELGNQQGFWAVLGLLPFLTPVFLVFTAIAAHSIGKKLQKDDWFVVLAIILPLVWTVWLAVDHSTWASAKKTVPKSRKSSSTKTAA